MQHIEIWHSSCHNHCYEQSLQVFVIRARVIIDLRATQPTLTFETDVKPHSACDSDQYTPQYIERYMDKN